MTTARITAILCTYNHYEMASETIRSLVEQEGVLFSVVVVDNSPDDERATAFALTHSGDDVVFVRQRQAGLARARNTGLATCMTEFVAFIDDDALADRRWLAQIVAAFDSASADTAIVGGKVLPRWEAPRPDWLPSSALSYLSLVDRGERLRELVGREWLAGTNIAFRREQLTEAGGFSTRLGRTGDGPSLMSNEETEAMRRLVALGNRAFYQPSAVVEHRIRADRLTRDWFRRRVAWQCVSDFMVDPEFASQRATRAQRAAPQRAVIGRESAAQQFRREMKAVYAETAALLEGRRRRSRKPAAMLESFLRSVLAK